MHHLQWRREGFCRPGHRSVVPPLQAWTGHCAVAQAPHPLRRTQAPPGPFEIFDVCARYREKFYYRCGPLPTPLVVMIAKLSFIGIPKIASLSDWLQLLICLHKAPINTRCIRSFIKPSTLSSEEGGSSLASLPRPTYIAMSVLRTTFNANI